MTVTAYHDLDTPPDMRGDAALVGARTPLLAPGIRYEEFPQDLPKPVVEIDAATAALGAAFDRG